MITGQSRLIILRTIPYGDTSLVAHTFTQEYGFQLFMLKGVRKASKKNPVAAAFEPGNILDAVVEINANRNFQYLKEYSRSFVPIHTSSSVVLHSVSLFMSEMLGKVCTEPEKNVPLFQFAEQMFKTLESSQPSEVAWMPLYFAVNLTDFFGVKAYPPTPGALYFDVGEGNFSEQPPTVGTWLNEKASAAIAAVLEVEEYGAHNFPSIERSIRKEALDGMMLFYQYHFINFGKLRSLEIISEVLG